MKLFFSPFVELVVDIVTPLIPRRHDCRMITRKSRSSLARFCVSPCLSEALTNALGLLSRALHSCGWVTWVLVIRRQTSGLFSSSILLVVEVVKPKKLLETILKPVRYGQNHVERGHSTCNAAC